MRTAALSGTAKGASSRAAMQGRKSRSAGAMLRNQRPKTTPDVCVRFAERRWVRSRSNYIHGEHFFIRTTVRLIRIGRTKRLAPSLSR